MIPHFSRVIIAVVIVSLGSSRMMAQEAHSTSSNKTVTFAQADNVNELYVGIMGEVDTPGTYRLDSSSLKLHHLVQAARGFTSDASRAIRIIRAGRVRQKEIFSEQTDSPLMPGDLLVVESRRSAFRSGKIASTVANDTETIRAGYEEGTIRAGVQIALVNALDYPVVLRLRADQANAAYLIHALGQPSALLARTRIITPDLPGRLTSDMAKRAPRLEDGTVLVFEPGTVNRNQLPVTLPVPYDGNAHQAPRSGLARRQTQSASDIRNLGQHPFWSSSDPFELPQDVRSHSAFDTKGTLDHVPNVLVDEQNVQMTSTGTDIADEGSDVTDLQTTSTLVQHRSEEETHSAPIPIAGPVVTETSIDVEIPQYSVFPLLLVFFVVGAIFGLIVQINRFLLNAMTKRKTAAKESETQIQPSMPAVASDDLIVRHVTRPEGNPKLRLETPEAHERMTIPMHSIVDPTAKRPSEGSNTSSKPAAIGDGEAETKSTPLAQALLQLDQRRRA